MQIPESFAEAFANPVQFAEFLARMDAEAAAEAARMSAALNEQPSSWKPVDLTPYLDGTIVRPETSIGLAREDGLRLLYPGHEHAVIGEMESGKSWYAAACAAAELDAGNAVLYLHFEEADPGDTVERLRALGVADAVLLERFRFVGPGERVSAEATAALLNPVPALVVLDGVNEAMALHGWKINDADGAADYRRYLVKPFTAAGAAVLSADHVTKDRETRGRYALGSIHKGNGLTGSLILLENADPFGRGMRGRSHVYVLKDRPGHIRRHGKATKIPGKTFLGELTVDDTDTEMEFGKLWLHFWPPAEHVEPGRLVGNEDDDAVLNAVQTIIGNGGTANVRAIRAQLRGTLNHPATDDALERLVLAGRLDETTGKYGARVFSIPAPLNLDAMRQLGGEES